MLSKSLLQFSVDGQSCVPSLLFDLRPNHGEGNEDNGDLLQKVLCRYCPTQCPQPCSRPSLTHASGRNSWTLKGKSGSVSCRVTAPFSWVLVHTRFCLCPPRVCFPVLCKFWWLYGGVNGNFLQEEEPQIRLPTSVGSSKKAREFQQNTYFCFIGYAKAFDCVDHNKLWKFLKRWEYQTT